MLSLSLAVVLSAISAWGFPVKTGAPVTDTNILQLALTLEHTEVAFYSQALAKFSEIDFIEDGLPAFARGRVEQILEHEQTHVTFLTNTIGPGAAVSCTYSFPFSTPKAFATLSAVIEGVGTSAYLGADNAFKNTTLIQEIGSILTTEARQQAFVNSVLNLQTPWSTSFDTPIDASEAFSLAVGFIVSCPDTNPALPIVELNPLTIVTANPVAGQTLEVSFPTTSTSSDAKFLALLTGMHHLFEPLTITSTANGITNATATLPNGLLGTVYTLVTSSESTADADTVAGAQVLKFPVGPNQNDSG